MNYSNTLEFAQKLDENDELGSYRNEFYIPKDQMETNSSICVEIPWDFSQKEQKIY